MRYSYWRGTVAVGRGIDNVWQVDRREAAYVGAAPNSRTH